MFRAFWGCLIVLCAVSNVAWAECADGYTAYLGPASDLVRNAKGTCTKLCGAGVTSLNTSNGYKFDLFAEKNTFPAIHVKTGSAICYVDLLEDAGAATLNVSYDEKTYHATPSTGELCPVTYNLSFGCGDGATGTPPASRQIAYRHLFTAPFDVGECYRPGYSHTGWKIDSSSYTMGYYSNYTYTTDKTMIAQWTANAYGGALFCNYCTVGVIPESANVTGTYASSFTPPASPSCTNPLNQELLYYDVLSASGESLGQTLTPGVSTTWQWPQNIRLRAVWKQEYNIPTPTYYTLSFGCGDGATGTPPASRQIAYRHLFTAPFDVGECYRPGYSHTGWKIDSSSYTMGYYSNYTYTTDKTMIAQWTANAYGGAIICDNGTVGSSYVTGTYGASVTPSTTACTAPDGKTFSGYKILDVYGNDTGDIVSSGSSFTWNYPYNIRLVAIWK